MSTKKLQILTPIVTSINGKTGDVTIDMDKTAVGLDKVDNTSDADKPISTATQTALDSKQDKITAKGLLKCDGNGNITAATEVFYATYGTTSYAEVDAAHKAGKIVKCINNVTTDGTEKCIGDLRYFSNSVYGFVCHSDGLFKSSEDGKTVGRSYTQFWYLYSSNKWNSSQEDLFPTYVSVEGALDKIYDQISTGICVRENLLKNWYMPNVINSQGKTEYTGTGMIVDGWKANSDGCYFTVHNYYDDVVSFEETSANTSNVYYVQNLDTVVNGTVTLSLYYRTVINGDSNISFWYGKSSENTTPFICYASKTNVSNTPTVVSKTFTATDMNKIGITIPNSSRLDLIAIKLEIGSQSTLAYKNDSGEWGLNEIPSYNLELAKCRLAYNTNYDAMLQNQVNPNLLINWYLGNPINQRGESNYTGSVYGIDMWKGTNSSVKTTITSTGLTLSSTSSTTQALLQQKIEFPNNLLGQTITMSVLTTDGKLYYSTGTIPATLPTTTTTYCNVSNVLEFDAIKETNSTSLYARIKAPQGGSITVKAVKLEFGSVQTLAHKDSNSKWVLNEVPNYSEELRKCQRYLQIFCSKSDSSTNPMFYGHASSATACWVSIPLAVSMRTSPSVSVKDVSLFKVGKLSTALLNVTQITGGWNVRTNQGDCVSRSIYLTSSNMDAGNMYAVYVSNGAQLILSAEM